MKNKLPVSKKPIPVKIVNDSPKATVASDDKWRVEDALRTLRRAEEIRQDKGLMKQAKVMAKKEAAALSKIK